MRRVGREELMKTGKEEKRWTVIPIPAQSGIIYIEYLITNT
jgi:hypothetical protein